MSIPCSIIKDLLPLYHDDVCSEETKQAVEEHLKVCSSCRNEYEKLLASDDVAERSFDEERSKNVARSYKKVKKRNNWKIVLAAVLAFVLTAVAALTTIFGIKVYNSIPIYPQPMKEIKTVDELKDELEKAKLDFLIPDPELLHSEQNYEAVLYLTGRTRHSKAINYHMSGHSEEIGYFWQAGVNPGQPAVVTTGEEYNGVFFQCAEYTMDPADDGSEDSNRLVISYVFDYNGAHYWLDGNFGIFDMEEDEIEAKKLIVKEDLLNTLKGMIDSAK